MKDQEPKAPRARKSSFRRALGAGLLALSLLPTLGVALRASADEDDSPWAAKRRVLATMATDPSVLINVTGREMPASPDILNLGKRASGALARCLSDNIDAGIRVTCAMLLGRLGDKSALPALQAALEDWEPSVRYQALEALRTMPDPSSLEPLLRLHARRDEETFTRRKVLSALGALGQTKAVTVLRAELAKKPETGRSGDRAIAFRALWMSRHLMARETLVGDVVQALKSDETPLVEAATEAAAELRAPRLVAPLAALLDHKDDDVRNKAVYALGLIGDKTATKALLARLPGVRDARMLNNIAFALERLDRDAFYASIRKVIEHKQAIIRLNAAFVLGDVKRPEGIPLLVTALDDPSDYVKTSAVVALGKLGTEEAVKPLERFVDAPNLSLRQEAIYAIASQRGAAANDLVYDKLFQTRSYAVQRRAAIALGKAGDARVSDYLVACLESSGCSVAEAGDFVLGARSPAVSGRMLLAWARDRSDLTGLVSKLRPQGTLPIAMSAMDAAMAQGDERVAKRAIDLLGDLGDASARDRIDDKLDDADTWLRLHAAVAVARLGDPKAEAALLREIDNLPAAWLPPFASLLRRIEEPEVRARLAAELDKRTKLADPDVALAAASIRLAWDPEASFFRFLDGLASPSVRERELSESYLRRDRSDKVTWLLRRALGREKRDDTRDRLRSLLDARPG